MKREFLQGLSQNNTPLSKEIIDAIMAENGRDIEKAKSGSKDTAALEQQLEALREKLTEQNKSHEKEMDALRLRNTVEQKIMKARGRNVRAISALMDFNEISACQEPEKAVDEAIKAIKQENTYLFDTEATLAFAPGTGTMHNANTSAPATLAGAIREKFERKF